MMKSRKCRSLLATTIMILCGCGTARSIEPGEFRLLSVSESSKLILVSQHPDKTKYVFDASSAKITIDEKPAEFDRLSSYSVVRVKFTINKSSMNGIEVDGVASEIIISTPENPG